MNSIKAVLRKQRQTQVWLTEKLGMNPVTVSKYCNNRAQPNLNVLGKIAKVLRVDILELVVSTRRSKPAKPPEEDYIPYGAEWQKEMKKFKKAELLIQVEQIIQAKEREIEQANFVADCQMKIAGEKADLVDDLFKKIEELKSKLKNG